MPPTTMDPEEQQTHRAQPEDHRAYKGLTAYNDRQLPIFEPDPMIAPPVTFEIAAKRRRRVMVMPSGSPAILDGAGLPVYQPSSQQDGDLQAHGQPEDEDDCAFCLRSQAGFSNYLVARDENGRWVRNYGRNPDLSGVRRRLFQSDHHDQSEEESQDGHTDQSGQSDDTDEDEQDSQDEEDDQSDSDYASTGDSSNEIADLRTTEELPERADVVIIGSGISGAATAWNLLRDGNSSSPSIVMLEARQACSGGHTKAASYRSFLDNAAALGTTAAVKIARLELANINAMHDFAKQHSIPCDSNPCPTVDIIYDEPHWREAHEAVEAMRSALGPDDPAAAYSFHDKDEVRTRFHCAGTDPEPVGGVSYAAGSISGYQLGVGVLRMALGRGLNLQTGTPATRLERINDSGGWQVHTPRGCIVADNVVLATNGYTAHVWKPFQGVIVPLRGQVTAHRPGDNMPVKGLPTTYSFIYDNGYEYMIPRPVNAKNAGDIVIGGGLVRAPDEGLHEYGTTDDTAMNDAISSYLYDTTPRYFGDNWGRDHPDGRIRKEWTGIMGYSPDGFPFVGEVPGQKGLWASCSFQGHGMVLCWMCARALVQMIQGKGQSLGEWFPEEFIITEQRMKKGFQGRLHTSAAVENHRAD
ncbi:hypothetical protein VMCG_05950 [Cytospora schulzeri]|uniref:FAD dependent oxidoreductase domain-containing protein n=1 Tax=Cytospora schulzeri TaxID=448051 RepID=A0A423WD70_9PEZI|nr:hypothetical protein VMCG_05950 [Valsa malicola]